MEMAITLDGELPEEERARIDRDESYLRLLTRLSHQSVVKHFDAFVDIPWDDPAYAIDPADPRLTLAEDDPLGATAWYRAQPEAVRARIGLHMIATFARIGYAFESVLKRGLLEFTSKLPVGAPEFRYCYHEVIEEAQHGLFFHEFVRRTGLDVRPPRLLGVAEHQVIRMGRRFPELFFMFVLSGEDPIDWAQRRLLHSGRELHPLIERISRIHITEEARHMSFARHFLKRNVPNLPAWRMTLMRVRTPVVFAVSSQFMMRPSEHIVRTYGIPKETLREAYGRGSLGRRRTIEALGKPRDLCWELGILNERWAPLWKRLGVYARRGR
jgi:hypothetical protein